MKKMFILALMLAAPAIVNAGDVGVIEQALGEQCGLVASVTDGATDGCGGTTASSINVTYTIGAQAYKTYQIRASYINSSDEEFALAPTGDGTTDVNGDVFLYVERSSNVSLNTSYSAGPGLYQLKLSVLNADTGAELCTAQQLVTVRN